MDKAARLERRIQTIKQALADLGPMRPGSVSVQTRKWGGQYRHLSYTHQGKGHTEYVPPGRLKDLRRQLANYRKFKELTQEWVELAIQLCKLRARQNDNEK